MAKWIIEGADKNTGADRTMTVDSATEESAAKDASAAGMLISSIRQQQEIPPVSLSAKPPESPFTRIVASAKMLEIFAAIVSAIGWIFIAIAGICLLAALANLDLETTPMPAVASFGSCLVGGVIFIVAGEMLRLLAATARAVRVIAINSCKP